MSFYHKIPRLAAAALLIFAAASGAAGQARAAGDPAAVSGEMLTADSASASNREDVVEPNGETDADIISSTEETTTSGETTAETTGETTAGETTAETTGETTAETTAETEEVSGESGIPAPVLVSAKAGANGITVKWKKTANRYHIRKYIIFRKESGGTYRRVAQRTVSQGVSWTDTSVLAGHTYTYTVRAVGIVNGKLTRSGYYTAGVTATARIPAVKLKSIGVSSGRIVVRWKKVPGVTGYRVYRKTGSSTYRIIADLKGAQTVRFTDSSCEAGHRYTYTVRAYVRDGEKVRLGSYDRTGLTKQLPLSQAKMRSARAGNGRIFVSWTPVKGADGYILYRRTGSGSYVKVRKLPGYMRNYCWDWTAKPGRTYRYKVAAYVSAGSRILVSSASGASSSVTALPATPQIASVRRNGKWDIVQWNRSSGASGYLFYRKTESGQWKLVKKLGANAEKIRVKAGSGARTYGIRAFVKVGGKRLLSPYADRVSMPDTEYSDQKILFLGDSITYGRMQTYGTAKVRTRVPYPARVGLLTGAKITNRSYSSETLAYKSSGNSLMVRIRRGQVRLSGPSVIFVALGTNDYGHSIRLGTSSDTGISTFYGALNSFMAAVKEQNPEAKVVFMTPIYRAQCRTNWKNSGYNSKNPAGYTLSDYCDAIVEIAKKNGAYVLDSRTEKVITAQNASRLLYDGLHPNEEGHAAIAKSVAAFLKKYVFSAE